MQRTFIYYTDPGHGWAKVSVKLLENIGIADKITSSSYYRNGFAYLEEDVDMPLLVNRLRTLKVEPNFRIQNSDNHSRIRNYASYDKSHYTRKTKVKIVSITYRMELTEKIMEELLLAFLEKGQGLAWTLIKAGKGRILDVNYTMKEPAAIHIQIKIDDPKQIKAEGEIWQTISRVINEHIKKE